MWLFVLADSEDGWIFQKVDSTEKVQGFFGSSADWIKGGVLEQWSVTFFDPLNVLQNTFL